MIFKQIDEILSGQKTQTRRVVKPGEFVYQHGNQNPDGIWAIDTVFTLIDNPEKHEYKDRIKWKVGRTYAVVPKRGKPGVWWSDLYLGSVSHPLVIEKPDAATQAYRIETGWRPLRIRIVAIRREHLQDITEADAKAEGVSSKGEYAKLWNRINKRKGTRWSDNPLVWALTFEVVKERETQS